MGQGDIAKLRRKNRWTQAELAERTGFSVGYIAAIEEGRVFPSLKALAIIANCLGVSMEDLSEGRGEKE